MFKLVLFVVVSFHSSIAFGQDTVFSKKIVLGKTEVQLHNTCFANGYSGISFINLHDNENTSVDAADSFLQLYGGCMMQLKHSCERNIDFEVSGKKYLFDPNRIFTSTGIKNTLTTLSTYHNKPAAIISKFAKEIVKDYVIGKKLIVALHNNSEGNYSLLSYTEGQSEVRNALRVYINPEMDTDDFIYTTVPAIFDTLQARMINVVLQNNETLVDDGSLSVYVSRLNIPYINIEAQEGHLLEQGKLLQALVEIFAWYKD